MSLSVLANDPDVACQWDSGDPYGSAMSLWFDAAEYLYFELGEDVPDHWKFGPSPFQTEIEPGNFFAGMYYTVAEIREIGDACQQISEACKANGQAY